MSKRQTHSISISSTTETLRYSLINQTDQYKTAYPIIYDNTPSQLLITNNNNNNNNNNKSDNQIIKPNWSQLFRNILIDLALLSKLLRGKYHSNKYYSNKSPDICNNFTCNNNNNNKNNNNNNNNICNNSPEINNNKSTNLQLATNRQLCNKRKFCVFGGNSHSNNNNSSSSPSSSPRQQHHHHHHYHHHGEMVTVDTSCHGSPTAGRVLIIGAGLKCISDYGASRLAHYQDPKLYDASGKIAQTRPSRRSSNLSGYSISSEKQDDYEINNNEEEEDNENNPDYLATQEVETEIGVQGIFSDDEIILEGIEILKNRSERKEDDTKEMVDENEEIEFDLEFRDRDSGRLLNSRAGSKTSRTRTGSVSGGAGTGNGSSEPKGGSKSGSSSQNNNNQNNENNDSGVARAANNGTNSSNNARGNSAGESSSWFNFSGSSGSGGDDQRRRSSFNNNNNNNNRNIRQSQQLQQPPNSASVPINIRRNNGSRGCYFCWCCCCSCSCLTVKPKMEEPLRSQISNEPQSRFEAISSEEKVTLEEAQKWSQNFDYLMQSKGGSKVFHEFLKLEYSEENIMFYRAVEELQCETNTDIIEEKAHAIYEDYISILSPKEVSLDSKVREIINSDMVQPTSHIFDDAQLQIYTLMQRDSYPRFINSRLYKDFLHQLGGSSNSSRHSTSGLSTSPPAVST